MFTTAMYNKLHNLASIADIDKSALTLMVQKDILHGEKYCEGTALIWLLR